MTSGLSAVPTHGLTGRTVRYGDFPDSLAEMDSNVGELLDAVDDLGVRDDTIFIFTSDNLP